jgi:formate dehydrogenase accessory protein FdhE
MRETWDQRIQRATELARGNDGVRSLLMFYAELLALQKQLYGHFQGRSHWILRGTLDRDGAVVRKAARTLISAIANDAPNLLADDARQLLADGDAAVHERLVAYWCSPSDQQFLAKAVLQPYAQSLAEHGIRLADRSLARADNRCPVCGGTPQVSILEQRADAEGAARHLFCATCLTRWPFRRVVCVSCGEADERKLAYFQSPSFDHLRIDACDTCGRYLKTVDRTRFGLAVPLVDEVAGAPLDIWARDHGYQKLELNLVGL